MLVTTKVSTYPSASASFNVIVILSISVNFRCQSVSLITSFVYPRDESNFVVVTFQFAPTYLSNIKRYLYILICFPNRRCRRRPLRCTTPFKGNFALHRFILISCLPSTSCLGWRRVCPSSRLRAVDVQDLV